MRKTIAPMNRPSMAERVPLKTMANTISGRGCQRGHLLPSGFFQALESQAEEYGHQQPSSEIIGMSEGSGWPNDGEGAFARLVGRDWKQRVPAEVLRDSVERGQGSARPWWLAKVYGD